MRIPGFTFATRLYQADATLVYAGVRDSDGIPVVAKVVAGGIRDLTTEFQILEKLAGPGVVEALGLFDGSEGPALVQRQFGDGSLADALRAGPFEIRRALTVGIFLARTLARIHAERVLHRDLKPANILFDSRDDSLALADFGIAVELPPNVRHLPAADLIGTPAYLSPEQTGRTTDGCDVRSDLYSFGVVLYEILTGTLPFAATDLAELVAAHLSKVPEPPRDRKTEIPAILSTLVMKLLAKSPDARYQSARGLALDLEHCLASLASDGCVPDFELARSDLVRPRAAQCLYGRDFEAEIFESAASRAKDGKPTLVIVAGEPGSGRKAFVQQMLRAHAGPSICASAAWQESGERPLSAISLALSGAARDVLLRSDDEVNSLRETLPDQLGQIGQVILDIAPEWSHVLGKQPDLPALAPREARTRLQNAFRRFARGLGEHALFVLALGNMDFADAASVDLVQSLLDADADGRVLVVASVKTPLDLAALRDLPATVCIELGSLSLDAVTDWTSEMLACSLEHSASAAQVLHDRTGGNPGTVVALLEHFVDTGAIERVDGVFGWEISRLRAAQAPPSLAAHAAQRVGKLSPERRGVLAAVACADDACGVDELASMLQRDPAGVTDDLAALEREGLVLASPRGGFALSHATVGQSATSATSAHLVAEMRGRLAAYLLESTSDEALSRDPFRVAALLNRSDLKLHDRDRPRAARLYELAAIQATSLAAYEDSATFFERGASLVERPTDEDERELLFRMQVGLARSLMMLAQHDRADELMTWICQRDLTPHQVGIVYPSRADNHSVVMNRAAAVDVGLEGLARLGFSLPEDPPLQDAIAVLAENEVKLATMSIPDHIGLAPAHDARAIAAVKIVSTLSGPLMLMGRSSLYLLALETALKLNLEHGTTRYYASLLSTHSMLLHGRLGKYDASRRSYEACQAVQEAHPAPEIDGRTHLVLSYLICPWFGRWKDSLLPLAKAIDLAVEAGDPLFAALSASASITLMSMCGTPLDQIVSAIEGWTQIMKADGGVAANASNVLNIARKLSRGEPIEQADLDRVSNVSAAAGAMRNNAMVNLGLALCVIGHEPQVRLWIREVGSTFPTFNPSQPHRVTLWLLEALFAARDAAAGQTERLAEAEERATILRQLQLQTQTTNHEASIFLIEAEIARARGELERASGLYGRASSAARRLDLTPLVAYAMEQRAAMATECGCEDEADLFFRESVIAYRRWCHGTKVRELERQRPILRALELSPNRGASASTMRDAGPRFTQTSRLTANVTINETLDLEAVLEMSQQISTQLHASDVARVVLCGIAENAGAQRVVFVLRDPSQCDIVYGEFVEGEYKEIGCVLTTYSQLPETVLRLSRRTSSPIVIGDARLDPNHASDSFVLAVGCRSIAVVPIVRKGSIGGFVLLENRLVAGAFSPRLVEIVQALVAQAAISLDNASLYENLENRVRERTAALHARNSEMRMLFDNVSQGLIMVDRDGRLSAERSSILDRWFSEGVPSGLGGFFQTDPMFEIGWEQLVDGVMPAELCIDQLPQRLVQDERTLAISWKPILDDAGEMARMLVVMSDVTEALRREELEREQKQWMSIFERLTRDRDGVVEFLEEGTAIVAELSAATKSIEVEKRLIHTLKGNSAVLGLKALSELCHEAENDMSVESGGLTHARRTSISDAWACVQSQIGRFVNVDAGVMQVRRTDYESALQTLAAEGNPLADDLALWDLEAFEARFMRISEQARELAQRLGKSPIQIQLVHGDIRIEAERWAPFWTAFVHALRNAIDHGLETADERKSLGKGVGTLRLQAELTDRALVLDFADDGRGIAWDEVRRKARAANLAAESREDLVAALFSDGFSTKASADENSGRGVGMGALAQACQRMEGAISVESAPGGGTKWRFEFPSALARTSRTRGTLQDPERR